MDARLLPNNRDELKLLLNDMRTKGATDDELSAAVKEIKLAKPNVNWSTGATPAIPTSPLGALKSLAAPFANVAKFEPPAPRVSPFKGGTTGGSGATGDTTNYEELAKKKYDEVIKQTGNPQYAAMEAQKIASTGKPSTAESIYKAAEAGVGQAWQGAKNIGSAITGSSETGEPLSAEQRLYKGVGGTFDVIGGGMGTVFSPITGTAESGSPEIKAVAGAINKPFEWASAGGEALTDAFTRLVNGGDLTPEQEEIIKQGWQLLPQLGAMKYGEYKARQAQGLAPTIFEKVAKPIVEAPIKATVATAKGIGKAASGAVDYAVTQATGLTPATRETIKAGGVAGKSATPEGIQVAKEGALSKVTNQVEQAIREKSAIGKGYEAIRNQPGTVNIGSYLDEKLTEAGLQVKNGKIMATGESLIRNPADIAKLQNIYNMYGKKGNLSTKEFLNLREDVANLVDYTTGTTPGLDIYGKGLRADLNEKFRSQVPGLEATDTKYRPALQMLKELKEGLYQKNGELKPGAGDYLANLAGNTLAKKNKLKLLEKQVPGITAEVNAINALKNIEKAGATHPGMYFRMSTAPLIAGYAGGPITALATLIAASPAVTVPILQAYGKLKSGVAGVVNSAIAKIKSGIGLSEAEASVLKQAIEEPKLNTPKVIEQVKAKVTPAPKSVEVPSVKTPTVKPQAATSSPLLAEAKKYSTANQFINELKISFERYALGKDGGNMIFGNKKFMPNQVVEIDNYLRSLGSNPDSAALNLWNQAHGKNK